MRRGVALAALVVVVVVVVLGGRDAWAAGDISTGTLRQAIFPRADAATRDLGIRDEEGRPLYLASFEWARWRRGGPGTYVALAVATTARDVGPGPGCTRAGGTVPGGVLVAVVRQEMVKHKKKLKVVAHDSRQVTFGCDHGTSIEALALDLGPFPLTEAEHGFAVRLRLTAPGERRHEEVVLYRLVGFDLRVALETDHALRDRRHEYQVGLAPAKTKTKGFFDLVRRVTARPLPPAEAAPASQAAGPRRPVVLSTVFRWNGKWYAAAK
jgi:hypothetical protein